jgi:hypothetical protein
MNAAGIHERGTGDHHEDALLISVNVEYGVERQLDVFFAVMEEVR